MSSTVNIEVIKEVFETMKYTEKENLNFHLQSHQNSDEEINAFLKQFEKNDTWNNLANGDREKLINKLASKIEKDIDDFASIGDTEGSSFTYTKQKSLPFLIESLRYHANFCELVDKKQEDFVVSILSNANSVSSLGYVLGPALAAGYRILFLPTCKLQSIVKVIEKTVTDLGFPEGTISVLPLNGDIELILKSAGVINLFNTTEMKLPNKKVMAVFPYLTPVVVLENADLDSVCECLINATWKNQLLFELTAKEVFVQDTVYERFVRKLKEKISNDTETIPKIYDNTIRNLISKANKNGIETFPPRQGDISSGKTVFIGGRLFDSITPSAPCVSVVSFRNIDEAVSLANNNMQGLGASLWTENIGLANYVAEKLDVSNVWINCFSIYAPDVAFTPKKFSGKGYFGGIQSFNELRYKKDSISKKDDMIMSKDADKLFSTAIFSAKKSYQSWSSSSRQTRTKVLLTAIRYIQNNKNKFISENVSVEWLDEWKTFFYQYIESHSNFPVSSSIKGYHLSVSYSPLGVLVSENYNKMLLIASILEGNTLILFKHELCQIFYEELAKQLPAGVLNIVPYFKGVASLASKNPMVDGYINEFDIDDIPLSHKFATVGTTLPDIYSKVTNLKNIWSNIRMK
ncbi:hypothetical protein HHI36_018404 [Cryptolaemus montrouzieri]|uniref:Aldehyde dehydrogenase domain-containing protein n=1 Tax=Cryptolaemus montrouzieri TaxID=559131 RepID=A0ABD2P090_9CUCU